MKKIFLTVSLLGMAVYGMACTNLIAGKKATTDGSVFCSYSADSYGMFTRQESIRQTRNDGSSTTTRM